VYASVARHDLQACNNCMCNGATVHVDESQVTAIATAEAEISSFHDVMSADSFDASLTATGKKLTAKCRMLEAENMDLRRQLQDSEVARLRGMIALARRENCQMNQRQTGAHSISLQPACSPAH